MLFLLYSERRIVNLFYMIFYNRYYLTAGNYTCPPNTFECEPGQCIDINQLCDGSRDCIGGIDEENCGE